MTKNRWRRTSRRKWFKLSTGCGIEQSALEAQLEIETTVGTRGYYLVVPETYDANTPTRLIFGYAGTNWLGEQIRPYLGLEAFSAPNDILCIRILWHDFEGWGNLGGWLLGPHAGPAEGMDDIEYKRIDRQFASGIALTHSKYMPPDTAGAVIWLRSSCFGRSISSNRSRGSKSPLLVRTCGQLRIECSGSTAVWTMFGINDDHFTSQSYGGEYGDECRDFGYKNIIVRE